MQNTEYVIIPICIPNNDIDYLKVSNIPISIWHHNDVTGSIIDPTNAEREAMKQAAQIYNWTETCGKLDFVYGTGTAGGRGCQKSAKKANERLIEKLKFCTKMDYMRGKY